MIKLSSGKTGSSVLLVYCSIVPHDFPPHYRLNYVKELCRRFNVIFIDLPAGFQRSFLPEAFKFYSLLAITFFRSSGSFVWEFFSYRKLSFFILYLYLLAQKILFNKKIVLYTTSGYLDQVYRYIPYDKSIFDCPDVHSGEFKNNKNLIRDFDLIFTNTKAVADKISVFTDKEVSVAAGYRSYKKPQFVSSKVPRSVLFLGGISQRIDYELLKEVIKKIPDIQFYFVGENYLNKYYAEKKDNNRALLWQKIQQFPNVHYLGELSDEYIDLIASFFRVGIIPYKASDTFNYYSNPIKLFDYLANGMFVVSTPLKNLLSYEKNYPVYIADGAGEFADKIKLALSKESSSYQIYENKIIELLKQQSLETKTSQVFKEIKKLFGGKI